MTGRTHLALHWSDIYRTLLQWLLSDAAAVQMNERTGHRVRVGRGGTAFRIDLSDRILPVTGTRKLFPKSAAAEVAWYLMGTQNVAWIRRHAPLWDKFVEADGETVTSAYGYRWRKHFGRDQINLAIDSLMRDSSDRRAFVSAWDPGLDGLGAMGQKNVPCPASFTLSVLDGQLHSSLFLRSSDVFVGLPYDVMGHALLMAAMAASMGLVPGVMHVTLAHAHLYEDHWEMAAQSLQEPLVLPQLVMPDWPVEEIEAWPDAYVEELKRLSSAVEWPAFNPKPFVVE